MPIIEHETSPAIAATVARTKRFLAGPLLSDSGMNAVIVNHPAGPYLPGQAAACGAMMRFEWTGIVSQGSFSGGYPPNQLFDQHAHRAFLPVGTNLNLKLIDIYFVNGASWQDAVVQPSFSLTNLCSWLSSKFPGWLQAEAMKLQDEMVGIVANQPNITICFPPHCIYRSNLMQAYPNHNWPI